MSRPRTTRLALAAGAAALVAASLTGCSGLVTPVGGGATRDEESQEVTEAGTESVFEITVGDCLLEPDGEEVFDVEAVPCAEAHDYEVYHEFEVDLGDEWPGEEAIGTAADEGCYAEFENFAGISFEESASLWYTAFTPLEASWADGDRLVQCIIYEASDDSGMEIAQVEGSLAGAAR
ncbi:septum formation family protein [Microbacterium sp. Marseille-Q6965]|uniref:septum formation family protein n=1 Tax=Microbacterium sp. Marseille-Q6965 TaxID=2965072 RepID=UPI0021B74608|nr:septum formation family protein [Microbacterium sp. Marseille-Q6965]